MNKEELREKRNRTIESINDIKAVLGLDELYIDELEKENAELKEKLNFSTQYYQGDKIKEQLTKAKEIITELLKYTDTEAVEMIKEAEQFLNCSEKPNN